MKNLSLFAAIFFCSALLFAENTVENSVPVFNWSLLWSGSCEEFSHENGILHNRGEILLNYVPLGLSLRGQILDKRALFTDSGSSPDFNGALYHKPTGSRLLIGVLDESGLPARIRNPWIRSAPYAENHKPLYADIKTAVSTTKEEEAYIYLASPVISFSPDVKLKSFIGAQTEIENFKPAVSGGLNFSLPKKTTLLLEGFYTGWELPATKNSAWFTYPPPLPERDFNLYAAALLFENKLLSIGSDIAYSETFAWGTGFYSNFGITVTPNLVQGSKTRPLSFSLAADGATERFVFRDGTTNKPGFRNAAKIEWKGRQNRMLRVNTVLRAPGIGDAFNRGSAGFYYRFPAITAKNEKLVRLTRISLTADRNAENTEKITDGLSWYTGFSVNLKQLSINTPLGLNLSGSIKGISESEGLLTPWEFNSGGISCEFTWFPDIYQFRSKVDYAKKANNDEKWGYSFSTAARFKHGRLSLKAATPDFPNNWNWTITWRLETRN